MRYTYYRTISQERNEIINKRYAEFIKFVDQPDSKPIKVFDELAPKLREELKVIRELSVELQKKKDEDMRKAAEAHAEALAEAKKAAQEAAKAAREAAKAAKEKEKAEARN